MIREWIEIPKTGGDYLISNLGEVKSVRNDRILKQVLNRPLGYNIVNLGSKNRNRYIHRMVAEAFVPNPEGLPEVNHKDFDKQNNSADNLEWVTRQGNSDHLHANKKIKHPSRVGTLNDNCRLTEREVIAIRGLRKISTSVKRIAEIFSISESYVYGICKGKTWKHLN
jgi:copper homeostasis protein CutC